MDQVSLSDAKVHLSAYALDVVNTHNRLSITRRGRRELVLISADDLDALEETLEILSSERLMADVDRARQELARGEVDFERPDWSDDAPDAT